MGPCPDSYNAENLGVINLSNIILVCVLCVRCARLVSGRGPGAEHTQSTRTGIIFDNFMTLRFSAKRSVPGPQLQKTEVS